MMQPQMTKGQWYKLDPPANINGKRFPKVFCEYQVSANPNEYSVRGVPEGGKKEEPFILVFKPDKGVKVTPSTPPPHLQVVK